MKKLFQWFAAVCLATVAMQASAQRTPVPVVDFVNVPVPVTAQPFTADQVRIAFVRAGAALNWKITPIADGQLQARFDKSSHTVIAKVTYDAKGWSVVYQDSVDMKFQPGPNATSPNVRQSHVLTSAWESQQRLFTNDVFTPYLVARTDGALHPFYEHWVRRLMTAVNAQLTTM